MNVTGGTGVDTVTGGTGNDVVAGGGGADVINGGAGDDTFNFTIAQAVVAGLTVNGGTGSDTLALTDAAAADFTGGTFTNLETITAVADGGADAIVIKQETFSAGAATITLASAADGDNDTITIAAGSTAWDTGGAEANAAAVDA